MGALLKCSSLDEIGTIVFHVTALDIATYETHATNSFEIIKAIIDENETQKRCVGQRYCRFWSGDLCHFYSIPI